MATEPLLVRDLAIVMVAAAATSILFQRLRQPTVFGYLVAGVLVGPHVFPVPLIREPESIATLAQLGTLFLLFSLGLEFHLARLRRVGGVAVTAGLLEVALTVGLGILVARGFGWSTTDGLFLGATLALSGAAVIVSTLSDLGKGSAATTQLVYGIVVVEKLVGVVLVAALSSIAITGALVAGPLVGLVVRLLAFLLVGLVVGLLLVPRLVDFVARLRVQETLVVAILGLAFGLSIISNLLGLSVALGAFLAGALIAESRASILVEQRIAPLRDAFVAVFFVAMGLLVDPALVVAHWIPVVILSAVVLVGKTLVVGLSTYVAGYPPRQAFEVGISMSVIGGFALVVVNLGADLGLTQPFLFPVLVAVSGITTLVTPNLMRHAGPLVNGVAERLPLRIRRYSRMYTAWASRHRPTESGLFQALYVPGTGRVIVYATLLAVAVVGAGIAAQRIGALGAPIAEEALVALTLAVFALVAVPLGIGLVRAIGSVIESLIGLFVPPRLLETRAGRAVAKLLRAVLRTFAAVVGITVMFAAAAVFLPPLPLVLAAILIVAVVGWLLRHELRRFDAEVDDTLDAILSDQAPPAERDEVLAMLEERPDWDLHVGTVLVPPRSPYAYHRIRDLELPRRIGATILTHEREGRRFVNPSADVVLEPGDSLGILGTRDQIEAAKRLLQTQTAELRPEAEELPPVAVEEIEVHAHSPVAGVPLDESRIRERTGATVCALRRAGAPLPNPGPETMLQPGDVLLVVGSPEQVGAARSLLASR